MSKQAAVTTQWCRLCRAAESKLDVAKELCQENTRLQEKMHHYRKEVRGLEASRHARTEEVQVLQAQLRCACMLTVNMSLGSKSLIAICRYANSERGAGAGSL